MSKVRKEDYVALAAFRKALREFLHFTEEGARAAGLTPQQHQVLLAAKGQPGKDWISVGALSESLQIKPNATVGLVNRCESAGLVTRTVDPEDRRIVRVAVTPLGEEILEALTIRNRRELGTLRKLIAALE